MYSYYIALMGEALFQYSGIGPLCGCKDLVVGSIPQLTLLVS
jgi:hypothetical protein